MTRAALGLLVPAVLTAGCASVLGVDKTYELADAGAGDVSTADGPTQATPIRCAAGAPCSAPAQECCLAGDGGLACVSTALSDPCPNGTDIPCDDPSDCAGGVCCLSVDPAMSVLGTRCALSCASGDYTLCNPQAPACTQGSCTSVATQPQPPSFFACQ